ncbi:MAG: hypothetical protein H6R19_1903 [Proteobacteria bacterium]|nr:hypothetical protein [Pseudomonadota bacterium]
MPTISRLFFAAMSVFVVSFAASAAELPATIKAKMGQYSAKLVEWAANPLLVSAVKEANAKGGPIAGMSNAKWDDLADNDPQVQALLKSPASMQLQKWEEDKSINKLFLRDEKGNMVGGSSKTLIYNAINRPTVKTALTGQVYVADEIKPDPTTQIKSVQVAVPVFDGKKVIGVLHTAITAE